MKLLVIGKYSLLIVILSIACSSMAAGGAKAHTLEGRINDIALLRAKIIDKIDQAVEIRRYLEQRSDKLQAEIRSEQMRADIHSYQAALQNLRIRNNLRLIQTLQAYIKLINERIDYYQTGNGRLRFLIDQIHDDLAIIGILKDMQTQDLIDRIDLVFNEFNPELQKPIINIAHIRLLPTEYVWENICLEDN
ncbi:MAG: hypothetical protein PVG35_14970 [Desulfobacterales bacterium]|jgi:hypothetical protein